MKKGYFIIVLIALLIVCNYHLILIKKNENQLLQFERVSSQSKKRVLLLGDSFAAYGVKNNKDLDLINFAYPGDHYGDMYFKIQQVSPPDFLILNTDPHLFLKDAEMISSKYSQKSKKLPWYQRMLPLINTTFRYEYGKFITNNIYRFLRSGEWNKKSIYFDEDWNLKRSSQYNWEEKVNKDRELLFFKKQFSGENAINNSSLAYFDSIHSFCREKEIKVLWLELPVSSEYSQMILAENAEVIPLIDSLKKEYGPLRHFKYDRIYYSMPEYFLDPVHLNNRGTEKFSALFHRELYALFKN